MSNGHTIERRFDIGHVRPDGRYNIWTKASPRGFEEWVIIHVAGSWRAAIGWIREQYAAPTEVLPQ